MFLGNLYVNLKGAKELWYTTGESGQSRRYHLFHIGFDNYNRKQPEGEVWCLNITIPFVTFSIGYVTKSG